MQPRSRRGFLRQAALGGAAATVGAAVSEVGAGDGPGGRHVIPDVPGRPYSKATLFGGVAYISGVLGVGADGKLVSSDFEAQARQVLKNLRSSVEAAGTTMDRALKCTCFLTEASDFKTFNKVYIEFFPSEPPARSTVVVKELVMAGAKVEIDCIAAV